MSSVLAKLLRAARIRAGISQLELSLRLGVSQRHVGFVELDRSRPSRALLAGWLDELGVDSAQRSAALLLAGYAPLLAQAVAERHDPEDVALRAVDLHAPNPGLAFDADWHIVHMNPAVRRLCRLVAPELPLHERRIDMLAVLADPRGWLARSRDPRPIAAALLAQLRAEQWLHPRLGPRVDALEAVLRRRYGTDPAAPARDPASTSFNVTIDTAIGPIAFTAVQAQFGLPHDAASRSLRAELWFPADARTTRLLRRHDAVESEAV